MKWTKRIKCNLQRKDITRVRLRWHCSRNLWLIFACFCIFSCIDYKPLSNGFRPGHASFAYFFFLGSFGLAISRLVSAILSVKQNWMWLCCRYVMQRLLNSLLVCATPNCVFEVAENNLSGFGVTSGAGSGSNNPSVEPNDGIIVVEIFISTLLCPACALPSADRFANLLPIGGRSW